MIIIIIIIIMEFWCEERPQMKLMGKWLLHYQIFGTIDLSVSDFDGLGI